jgi:trans-aconitate methyltransferase
MPAAFSTRPEHGKFVEWDRILDRLRLRGDEAVLDMGCGRGAVLTEVARRLTTGRVTGIKAAIRIDVSASLRRTDPVVTLARRAPIKTPGQSW